MPVKVVKLVTVDGVALRAEEAESLREAKRAARRQRSPTTGENGPEDGGEPAENPYDELFDAAQLQLQQEMTSAGMEGQLPMAFGGPRAIGRPRSKKRKRAATSAPITQVREVEASSQTTAKETALVEKVHVTFDSDGEEAARKVEHVEVEVKAPATSDATAEVSIKTTKQATPPPVAKEIRKFWAKRFLLFHKFGEGIQLDHESWYSVTPQGIAEHIAARCRCDVVVDPFAGCGGNVIQLAKTCRAVIAIDIDPDKIRMARHNAEIYGVTDKIEFIVGDSMQILPTLTSADVVFLSPPWGGVNYSRKRFDLDGMLVHGVSGSELFNMARKLTKNVVYYLPKTTPAEDLEALAPGEVVDCEMVVLNKQTSVMTAYYGDLATAKAGD